MLIFDRIVLAVLAVGVWALVLAPRETSSTAQETDWNAIAERLESGAHDCSFSWKGGYGEVDGGDVYVHSADATVDCGRHYY